MVVLLLLHYTLKSYICQCEVAHQSDFRTLRTESPELEHLKTGVAHGQDVDDHEHVHLHNVLKLELFSCVVREQK